MDHFRLRKYRGPETWAQVRKAYVAGESAPSVARRFDVGLSNLRRRAMAEGWTRARIDERLDLRALRGGADDPPPALMALAELETLPEPPGIERRTRRSERRSAARPGWSAKGSLPRPPTCFARPTRWTG